jgi:hypothetical protein
MTLGLAQAGCDIVGINRKIPHDTAAGSGAGPPLSCHSGGSQPTG